MSDEPKLVVAEDHLVKVDPQQGQLAVPASRMFEIRNALAAFRKKSPGTETFDLSQGDGGASLPGVPHLLLDRALEILKQQGTGYTPPVGADSFRKAVAEQYWALDASTGWGPDNVVAAQGGRDALVKAYDAALLLQGHRRGDFIVASAVPWISYKWGAFSFGANVMMAPGDEAEGWKLTGEGLRRCVGYAEELQRRVAMLVVTSPDNPTGRSTSVREQADLAAEALEMGVGFVLFDWIYNQVTAGQPQDVNELLSHLSTAHRQRVIVLDGLTKSLGASNIRNAHLLASDEVIQVVKSRASHGLIPSFYAQAVALAAYEQGRSAFASIVEPTNQSREVMRSWLQEKGFRHILGDGYYAFVDVRDRLARAGMADSSLLSAFTAEQHGIAVVPGAHFSAAGDNWLRLSYALPPETTVRALERLWQALSAL